jgi:hypothetical protein
VIQAWTNKGYDLTNPQATASKMWEQYKHLESHFGVSADKLIRLPNDANDAAGWQGVHQRLGVPKDGKDYDLAAVRFADGSDLEESFTAAMRGALLKANVSKEAATDLVKAVIQYFDDADSAEKAMHTASLNDEKTRLLKEWGPNAEMNRLTAMQAVKRLGVDPATVETLEQAMGYSKVMEMFRKIGAGTSEDTFVGGDNAHPTTAANAQSRLTQLQSDKEWVKRLMSGDMATRREFEALTEQIAGVVASAA